MSKSVEELLDSIIRDWALCEQDHGELEAKSLFRLLNYCPPPEDVLPEKSPSHE